VDRKLPHRLQTFAALYASWIEQTRSVRRESTGTLIRKLVRSLLLDAILLGAVIIGAAVSAEVVSLYLAQSLGLRESASRVLLLAAAVALATPLCIGIFRIARRLGLAIAAIALPRAAAGKVDPAAAPRGALVITVQVAVVLLVGLPLMALTQPFLTGMQGAIALALVLAVLGFAFWRGTTNLEGHVRAGAELIVEALGARRDSHAPPADLAEVRRLLPGLGEPTSIRLEAGSPAVGNTLAALNLRGLTGAMVLAISRAGDGVIAPSAREELKAGDLLALVGSREALEAATQLLHGTGVPDAGSGPRTEG
jgi:CPA2 family monovalent cation:H+ antiporter-2